MNTLQEVVHPPVSRRCSFLYLEHCRIELDDGVPTATTENAATPVPVGVLTCLMLGPGTTVTHGSMELLARLGCLVLWTGEHGIRMYSAGNPGGASGRRMMDQALCVADTGKRLDAARRLYRIMMGVDAPKARSIDQLRGLEGSWVRAEYARLAKEHNVPWKGRSQKIGDPANRAISMATSTLYGICEAVILALGLSPAMGIVHSGSERALVFDIADTVKFRTVVPEAFRVAGENGESTTLAGDVRRACRDLFAREHLMVRLVDICEQVVFGDALAGD